MQMRRVFIAFGLLLLAQESYQMSAIAPCKIPISHEKRMLKQALRDLKSASTNDERNDIQRSIRHFVDRAKVCTSTISRCVLPDAWRKPKPAPSIQKFCRLQDGHTIKKKCDPPSPTCHEFSEITKDCSSYWRWTSRLLRSPVAKVCKNPTLEQMTGGNPKFTCLNDSTRCSALKDAAETAESLRKQDADLVAHHEKENIKALDRAATMEQVAQQGKVFVNGVPVQMDITTAAGRALSVRNRKDLDAEGKRADQFLGAVGDAMDAEFIQWRGRWFAGQGPPSDFGTRFQSVLAAVASWHLSPDEIIALQRVAIAQATYSVSLMYFVTNPLRRDRYTTAIRNFCTPNNTNYAGHTDRKLMWDYVERLYDRSFRGTTISDLVKKACQ